MERARLLLARAQSAARGATGGGAPRRRVSARAHRDRGAARHRALDCGGDRRIRLRHARRDSGRQRQARAGAAFRRCRLPGREARRKAPVATGRGAVAAARDRALHPGDHGSGGDAVHARQDPPAPTARSRQAARRSRWRASGIFPRRARRRPCPPAPPTCCCSSETARCCWKSVRPRASGAGCGACPELADGASVRAHCRTQLWLQHRRAAAARPARARLYPLQAAYSAALVPGREARPGRARGGPDVADPGRGARRGDTRAGAQAHRATARGQARGRTAPTFSTRSPSTGTRAPWDAGPRSARAIPSGSP